MQKILALLILMIIAFNSYSQNNYSQTTCYGNPPQIPDSEKVFVSVEEMPEFPGGDEAMMKYFQTNVRFPSTSKDNYIQGTVFVYFEINREGSVENAKVVRGIKDGKDLEIEALRVINAMPKWKPGKNNGNKVKVQFTFPIKINLH